jgi:hypothetical protein
MNDVVAAIRQLPLPLAVGVTVFAGLMSMLVTGMFLVLVQNARRMLPRRYSVSDYLGAIGFWTFVSLIIAIGTAFVAFVIAPIVRP